MQIEYRNDFSGGMANPDLFTRQDLGTYNLQCKEAINWDTNIFGKLKRRKGTRAIINQNLQNQTYITIQSIVPSITAGTATINNSYFSIPYNQTQAQITYTTLNIEPELLRYNINFEKPVPDVEINVLPMDVIAPVIEIVSEATSIDYNVDCVIEYQGVGIASAVVLNNGTPDPHFTINISGGKIISISNNYTYQQLDEPEFTLQCTLTNPDTGEYAIVAFDVIESTTTFKVICNVLNGGTNVKNIEFKYMGVVDTNFKAVITNGVVVSVSNTETYRQESSPFFQYTYEFSAPKNVAVNVKYGAFLIDNFTIYNDGVVDPYFVVNKDANGTITSITNDHLYSADDTTNFTTSFSYQTYNISFKIDDDIYYATFPNDVPDTELLLPIQSQKHTLTTNSQAPFPLKISGNFYLEDLQSNPYNIRNFYVDNNHNYMLFITTSAIYFYDINDNYKLIQTSTLPNKITYIYGLKTTQIRDTFILCCGGVNSIPPYIIEYNGKDFDITPLNEHPQYIIPRRVYNETDPVLQNFKIEFANSQGQVQVRKVEGQTTNINWNDWVGRTILGKNGSFKITGTSGNDIGLGYWTTIGAEQIATATSLSYQMDPGQWTISEAPQSCWGGSRGWPTCCAYFEERLYFAGTNTEPNNIWASHTGEYYNFFMQNGLANDALDLRPTATDNNPITNMFANLGLVIQTKSNDWFITEGINSASIKKIGNLGIAEYSTAQMTGQYSFNIIGNGAWLTITRNGQFFDRITNTAIIDCAPISGVYGNSATLNSQEGNQIIVCEGGKKIACFNVMLDDTGQKVALCKYEFGSNIINTSSIINDVYVVNEYGVVGIFDRNAYMDSEIEVDINSTSITNPLLNDNIVYTMCDMTGKIIEEGLKPVNHTITFSKTYVGKYKIGEPFYCHYESLDCNIKEVDVSSPKRIIRADFYTEADELIVNEKTYANNHNGLLKAVYVSGSYKKTESLRIDYKLQKPITINSVRYKVDFGNSW